MGDGPEVTACKSIGKEEVTPVHSLFAAACFEEFLLAKIKLESTSNFNANPSPVLATSHHSISSDSSIQSRWKKHRNINQKAMFSSILLVVTACRLFDSQIKLIGIKYEVTFNDICAIRALRDKRVDLVMTLLRRQNMLHGILERNKSASALFTFPSQNTCWNLIR